MFPARSARSGKVNTITQGTKKWFHRCPEGTEPRGIESAYHWGWVPEKTLQRKKGHFNCTL